MPRNAGYLAGHAWADAQIEAGLNQSQCGKCGEWWFQQDLSNQTHSYELTDSKGNKVITTALICNDCINKEA